MQKKNLSYEYKLWGSGGESQWLDSQTKLTLTVSFAYLLSNANCELPMTKVKSSGYKQNQNWIFYLPLFQQRESPLATPAKKRKI